MKIEITAGGIYGKEGKPVPIGTVLTVKEEPKGWKGRYRVIGKTEGKEAITNPDNAAPAKSVDEVLAMAEDSNVQFMTFKAEATKILGDGAPSKKDDLIAALKAKQSA